MGQVLNYLAEYISLKFLIYSRYISSMQASPFNNLSNDMDFHIVIYHITTNHTNKLCHNLV